MDNGNIDTYYIELISSYLSGNASEAETVELEKWVLASDENRERFTTFKKAWILAGMKENLVEADVEDQWNHISQELFFGGKVVDMKSQRSFGRRWAPIAVAAGLAIFLAIWLLQGPLNKTTHIEQTLAEVKDLNLPDGSHIILNQYASLSLEDVSFENQRSVKLEGDAFFDVQRDENKPFLIQTSNVEIEVLGTSFYVDARSDQEEVRVVVESGSVAVRSGREEVVLLANESAVFEKSGKQLVKQANDDPNFLFLKSKTLAFDQVSLEEVIATVNRYYHSNISLQVEEGSPCYLTGAFQDKSLDAVITIIEETLGIEANRSASQVILTGTCK